MLKIPSNSDDAQTQMNEAYQQMQSLAEDYTKLRASLAVMIPRLATSLSRLIVETCAKKLRLYQNGNLLAQTPYEVSVFFDYCLFHSQQKGKNLVVQHLENNSLSLSEEEKAVYGVLKHAFFAVLKVEATLSASGIAVYDLIRKEHYILFDKSFAKTARPNMLIVCHLIKQPKLVLTTGASIPLSETGQTTKEVLSHLQKASFVNIEENPLEMTRLATEIFKACIWGDAILSINS